jgi:hypothetical protein
MLSRLADAAGLQATIGDCGHGSFFRRRLANDWSAGCSGF